MKVKWYKKKLTFLVIQDAHRSVFQLNLYKPLIYIVPTLVLAVCSALVFLYIHHNDSMEKNHLVVTSLTDQLTQSGIDYERTIISKNKTIDQLQNDIIALSQQADQIKAKVDDLLQLERELRDVTEPIANAETPRDLVSIASIQESQVRTQKKSTSDGVGGAHIPVSESEITRLAVDTESSYYVLDAQMDLLLDSLATAKGQILEYQEHLRVTPTLWPTTSQRITSGFGYRSDPFTKKPSFHSGIDFGGKRNDPIYATADGVVVTSSNNRNFGNYVIIKHENNIRTFYYHLQKSLVKSGQTVEKGEEIGLLGNTGRSTGPHLHYEIEKDGVKIDPKPYLLETRKDED